MCKMEKLILSNILFATWLFSEVIILFVVCEPLCHRVAQCSRSLICTRSELYATEMIVRLNSLLFNFKPPVRCKTIMYRHPVIYLALRLCTLNVTPGSWKIFAGHKKRNIKASARGTIIRLHQLRLFNKTNKFNPFLFSTTWHICHV